MKNEIWKIIKDFPRYEVSNLGRVRSLNYKNTGTARFLKPYLGKNGYFYVNLFNNGSMKHKYIHRLVLEQFVEKCEGKNYSDHINTIRTDNRMENLHWVSQTENMQNPLTNRKQSMNNDRALSVLRLTTINRKPIICVETGQIFPSITEAAQKLNAKHASISRCLYGKRATTRGFHFKFIEGKNELHQQV